MVTKIEIVNKIIRLNLTNSGIWWLVIRKTNDVTSLIMQIEIDIILWSKFEKTNICWVSQDKKVKRQILCIFDWANRDKMF